MKETEKPCKHYSPLSKQLQTTSLPEKNMQIKNIFKPGFWRLALLIQI